jgi:hypothetical protein
MDEADEAKRTARNLSNLMNVITQLLSITNCPPNYHSYVHGLVGVSRGFPQGEIKDEELATHIRGNANINKKSLAKWIHRLRDNFDDWQRELGIIFIECIPGGYNRATNTYRKSQYELPIIGYATIVINEAQKNAHWQSDSNRAIEEEALKLVNELKESPVFLAPKKSSTGYYSTEVTKNLRTAESLLTKAVRYSEDEDKGISNADETLVGELEKLVERLRQRVRS